MGGSVAECSGGLRGLKYGVTKHYIMGLEVVLAARAALAEHKGLPWMKKAVFAALKRPGLFDLGLKAGSVFQGLAFKKATESGLKVTYHDPCHLARGMGVSLQPREIIKVIPGVELAEMKNPARCCGGAGSFSVTHYDLSMDIQKHKTNDIAGTGADLVSTGCGSCRMQLEGGLAQQGLSKRVMHTIELLDLAYQEGKQKKPKPVEKKTTLQPKKKARKKQKLA